MCSAIAVNGGREIDGQMETAALEAASGHGGKEGLDGVKPRARGRREEEGPAGMTGEPAQHPRCAAPNARSPRMSRHGAADPSGSPCRAARRRSGSRPDARSGRPTAPCPACGWHRAAAPRQPGRPTRARRATSATFSRRPSSGRSEPAPLASGHGQLPLRQSERHYAYTQPSRNTRVSAQEEDSPIRLSLQPSFWQILDRVNGVADALGTLAKGR